MISVILLLGGNQGSVADTFNGVKADLEARVGHVERCSEQLRSASWGFRADDFLNEAVLVTTSLSAEELLDATQAIEQKWGREREAESEYKMASGARYLSRAIDIDIIFYGDESLQSERLTIPHPLMAERRFVLAPVAQIAPRKIHPVSGKSVEQMLKELDDE